MKTNHGTLKSEALFKEIEERIRASPDTAKAVKGIFVWVITKDGKTAGRLSEWISTLKEAANLFWNFLL